MKTNLTFEELEGALLLISYDAVDEDGTVERNTLPYTYASGKLKFYSCGNDEMEVDETFNPACHEVYKITTTEYNADDYKDADELIMAILRDEGKQIIKEAPYNEWEIVENKVSVVIYNAEREKVGEQSWKSHAKKTVAPKEPEMTEDEKLERFRRSFESKMYAEEQNFKSDRRMLFFHLFLMVVAGGLTAWLGYCLEWPTTKIWIFAVGMGAYFTQLWWCNDKRVPLGVAAPFERRCQYRPWINGGWIATTIVAGGLLWLTYKAGTLEENLDDIVTSWFIFIPVFTLVIRVVIGSTKPLGVRMAEEWFPSLHNGKIERREVRYFWAKFFRRLVWLD